MADAPFKQHTLTHSAPTGWAVDPETGNHVPTIEQHTITATVSVDRDRANQLHAQPGADKNLIPIKIELINPVSLPSTLTLGSTLQINWLNTAMVATIVGVIPNDVEGVNFGAVILAELTPEVPNE